MTDHELIRAAATGMTSAAFRAQESPDTGALSGLALALHVCAGLTSNDPYRQETCAMILDFWSRGEREHLAERLRTSLVGVMQANNTEEIEGVQADVDRG